MKMSKEEKKILFKEGFRFIKNNIDKAKKFGINSIYLNPNGSENLIKILDQLD